MSTLAEQKTLSEVLKENTRLQNQVESLNAYVAALQEQCRLASELIEAYKRKESMTKLLQAS